MRNVANEQLSSDIHRNRFFIAGHPVDPIGNTELLQRITDAVEHDRSLKLLHVNLHGLHCARGSSGMRAVLARPDAIVYVDGMPVVWMARAMGLSVATDARMTGIDLVPRILNMAAAKGWPVMFIGSEPGRVVAAEEALLAIAPGLSVCCRHGYFDLAEDGPGSLQREVLDAVRVFQPKILIIGMGMPRQEEWLNRIADRIDVPVVMLVGGFIDYFTGKSAMPPRWMGRFGLEWLFRLATNPRRLFHRYCVEPLTILFPVISDVAAARWSRRS